MVGAPQLLPLVRLDQLQGNEPPARSTSASTDGPCPCCGVDAEALIRKAVEQALTEVEQRIIAELDRRLSR